MSGIYNRTIIYRWFDQTTGFRGRDILRHRIYNSAWRHGTHHITPPYGVIRRDLHSKPKSLQPSAAWYRPVVAIAENRHDCRFTPRGIAIGRCSQTPGGRTTCYRIGHRHIGCLKRGKTFGRRIGYISRSIYDHQKCFHVWSSEVDQRMLAMLMISAKTPAAVTSEPAPYPLITIG